ncbi:hypothetical protein [Sphingomonas sp. 28-63-12]|uniref:hypothetical protein n=1 Tax=Sphingomonas sp. 28-63-12 TaxID=1970434 RepID=UPI000BD60922|nr:MAG: hypothetical protein B7Y47_13090 [Sphingomonas sp. 28-63-12]
MKIAPFIAAGLLIAGLGISAEASAEPYHGRAGYHEHHRGPVYVRPGYRVGYRDGYREDHRWRAPRYYGGYHGRRCFTEWRHHRRVTICR